MSSSVPAPPFAHKGWLALGVASLALSGLLAVVLVAARAPIVQEMVPVAHLFTRALTSHVNLSVLVWLLAMAGALWSGTHLSETRHAWLSKGCAWVTAVGAVLLAVSPFTGQSAPLLTNYIPAIYEPLFFAGLGLVTLGIGLLAVFHLMQVRMPASLHQVGSFSTALLVVFALVTFAVTFFKLEQPETKSALGVGEYMELAFWGGGHMLQFAYVQLVLIAWAALALRVGALPHWVQAWWPRLLLANVALAAVGFWPLLAYEVTSFAWLDGFTQHMRILGGLVPGIAGLWLLYGLWCARGRLNRTHYSFGLYVWSLILFASGGLIGLAISGTNTIIPAHYHGSIVGISLALMGAFWLAMEHQGVALPTRRIAKLQPALYGGGQLLHIIGLLISGGYGALRKTPGAVESFEGQFAMGLMGMGGLLSVLGGGIFVVLAVRALWLQHIIKGPKSR